MNSTNLRIVTKLQVMNDVYGANFTYGTLATIIKYPTDSVSSRYNNNKFGYFKSEEMVLCQDLDAMQNGELDIVLKETVDIIVMIMISR